MSQPSTLALPLPTSSSRHVRGLLAMISAITCVEFLETGMVTFAAASIMSGLGLGAEAFAFAFTLYGVAAIFMLYKHQWMVERLGYRNFILGSLAVFALGAVLCATADGLGQFAAGRALQGASGATFFTAGRLQMNRLPESARFSGLLVFVGTLLGAVALSPLAAAGLIHLAGWRTLFWAVLPLCALVALVAGPRLSREITPPEARSEEHWGWLLGLAVALFALQYALQAAQFTLFDAPGQVFAVGAASVGALTVFAVRQWKRERPLINYRGLFEPRYMAGLLFYFCGYFLMGLSGFLLPILFLHGLQLDMLHGAAILSGSLACSLIGALSHATLARQHARPRVFMLTGLALVALSCLGFGRWAGAGDWHLLLAPSLLVGLSIPFFVGPVAMGTFVHIAPSVFSHAYQVKNIIRQLGLSLAVTAGTLLLQWRYARHLDPQHPGLDWAAPLLHGQPGLPAHAAALALASGDVFNLCAAGVLILMGVVAVQRVFR